MNPLEPGGDPERLGIDLRIIIRRTTAHLADLRKRHAAAVVADVRRMFASVVKQDSAVTRLRRTSSLFRR